MTGFIKRHPQFTLQRTIMTESVRKDASTQTNLSPFYDLYKSFYDNPNYDRRLIFNADETSVNFTDSFRCKAVVKGSTNASISAGLEHTPSVTLLFCIGTYGAPLTTTLLWPQTRVPEELQSLSAYNIQVYANDSGWMNRSTFEYLMLKIYIPELVERRRILQAEEKAILLLLDGHSSRVSLPIIMACIKYNITVLIFPAHSSAITQPNDRGVNGTFKSWFAKLSLNHINSIQGIQQQGETTDQMVDKPAPCEDDDEYPPVPTLSPSHESFDIHSAAGYRYLLKLIIPESVYHALDLRVIATAWNICGLHPFDKQKALGKLPIGEACIEKPKTRKGPSISGRVLTSFEVEKEIMEWILNREEKQSKRQISDREKNAMKKAKLATIREKLEAVQHTIHIKEEQNATMRLNMEEERLRALSVVAGKLTPEVVQSEQAGQRLGESQGKSLIPTGGWGQPVGAQPVGGWGKWDDGGRRSTIDGWRKWALRRRSNTLYASRNPVLQLRNPIHTSSCWSIHTAKSLQSSF